MTPFYGWGSEALQRDSLLVTNKSSRVPGTYLIDAG